MPVLRWWRIVLVTAWLSLAMAIALFLPAICFAGIALDHRALGALAAAPACALLTATVASARRVAAAASQYVVAEDYVTSTVAAFQAAGLPRPVCVATNSGAPTGAIRGLRRLYVVAPAGAFGDDPAPLVAAARQDLRRGDARLYPMLGALGTAHQGWAQAFSFTTAAARRGPMRLRDRIVPFGPLLLLAPIVAVGLAGAWVGVQLARLVLPRQVDVLLAWFGTKDVLPAQAREVVVAADEGMFVDHSAFAHTAVVDGPVDRPKRRTWLNLPVALSRGFATSMLGGTAATALLAAVGFAAVYAGPGALVGQRVEWPGERIVPAVAESVQVDGGGEGLLARVGFDISARYDVLARTETGEAVPIWSATNPVEVGDRIDLVVDADGRARWRTEDSVAYLATISVFWFAFVMGGVKIVLDVTDFEVTRMSWAEYRQAELVGARARRPRGPWAAVHDDRAFGGR